MNIARGHAGHSTQNLWLPAAPGKRWTEVFFLAYSPFWIVWALGILVPFKIYEVRMSKNLARRRGRTRARVYVRA